MNTGVARVGYVLGSLARYLSMKRKISRDLSLGMQVKVDLRCMGWIGMSDFDDKLRQPGGSLDTYNIAI